jgi:hypothetical protein
MTEQSNEEMDAHWLAALSGRSTIDADAQIVRQADALRKALLVRKETLERAVPLADEALYQQLLFRLRREQLTGRPSVLSNPAGWSAAAVLVLGLAVAVQMRSQFQLDDGQVYRGGGQATVLIVENPEARLAELLDGLKNAGSTPRIKRLNGGKIGIKVEATAPVLEFLRTQRIDPVMKDGYAILTLELSKR